MYLSLSLSLSLYLSLSLSFFGQVMYPHHFDQMSQRSPVSRVALCISKVKGTVSQWVTRLPNELFWTAKNRSAEKTVTLFKTCIFWTQAVSKKVQQYVKLNFADNSNQMEMTQWSNGSIIEGKGETFENFDAEHCTAKRSQTGLLWLKSKQQEIFRSNTFFKHSS